MALDYRPVERRRAVRVLVVDHEEQILLFLDSDLGLDPVQHWWVTPGGGADPGESDAQTAVRELREETGLAVGEDQLVGPLAVRQVVHGYSDKVVRQDEVYYLLRVAGFDVDTSRHTTEEIATVADVRWWTRSELLEEDPVVWPRTLLEIWDLAGGVAAGAAPPGGPADLGVSEESTVPA